ARHRMAVRCSDREREGRSARHARRLASSVLEVPRGHLADDARAKTIRHQGRLMDTSIRAQDPDRDPVEAMLYEELNAIDRHYSRRQFNDIVRMKLAADMRRLADLAERHGRSPLAFAAIVDKWKRYRRENPQTFMQGRGGAPWLR